jgi:hypothetical protein
VLAGLDEGTEDGVALPGLLQADLLQVAMEDRLGLAHGFTRDHRMVVDPLLQHA